MTKEKEPTVTKDEAKHPEKDKPEKYPPSVIAKEHNKDWRVKQGIQEK